MRLIIDVPDNTDPALMAHIRAIAEKLNQAPEFASRIQLGRSVESETDVLVLSAEQIEIVEQRREEIRLGKSFTPDQVAEHFKAKKAEWIQSHPA